MLTTRSTIHTASRRFIATLTFVAALIAAGFASPHAAFAGLPISGSVCGYSDTVTTTGVSTYLTGTAGTVVTITFTSSVAGPNNGVILWAGGPTDIFYISNATSQTATATLPTSTLAPGVYGITITGLSGTTLTVSISCGGPNTVISTDGRLNNNGDQGAQSVAVYCNSDGSLNLIPLQLLNPGPGSTSIKDSNGNNVIVKTVPLGSMVVNTTASYSYGISVTAYSDGTWTVRRQELTTGKQYSFVVTPSACS